ncbi:MAG: DegV family protein [Lachnospiraceae bacterium]|nr:DegV family protein [Lachnospiraceae bacterium]
MKAVAVIADTTCDLSVELKEKYQIMTFPLHIHLGDKEYADGIDISPDDIYRWSDENKATPKTSGISPAEALEIVETALETAESVICFTISDQMSSTGSVLRMAVREMDAEDRVHIIDSMSLSTGIGLQIIEAALLAEQGMAAVDIVAKIEAMRSKVRASFVVDTLTYLHRGGRCSGLAALAGSALKLHPLISVVDGKMQPGKKYRGKMDRVIIDYVKDMEQELRNAKADRVFITHSGCEEEIIEAVKAEIEALGHFKEILVTRAGSVITSHCGPGTLGVLYVAGGVHE